MKNKKIQALLAVALVSGVVFSAQALEEKNLNDNKTAAASAESKPGANSDVNAKLDQKVAEADKKAEENGAQTKCRLNFNLKSWSAFYKSGKGDGTITCDNGEASDVAIRAKGGGMTFGKTHITDGKGSFSKVHNISEIYGSYASSEAHAGIVKSGDVRAMTKGDVSLAIHGTGKGVDLGIAFGAFKITPM